MGMVALLRFNSKTGAIGSDEETWNMRFRCKSYLDNIHRLVDPDISQEIGIEVAYGGTGFPSLHTEIIEKTRAHLRALWSDRGKEGASNPPFKTVEDVSRIALEMMHKVIRRRIDLRLKFFYGFETDDLMKGSFSHKGKTIEIAQDVVHDKAIKLATGEEDGRLAKAWFKSRATTFGYDSERGITGYYLDPQKFVMCFNYEGWDAIGSGKYASGAVLAQYLNRKPLQMRRTGYDPAEGLYVLLEAAQTATETFQETGGNINIVMINADAGSNSERYREIFDERAVLANEIVKIARKGYLEPKKAELFLDRLIFKNEKTAKIESEIMKKVVNPAACELMLRGYKLDEIPFILNQDGESSLSRRMQS
jgi:hypothetical protein